MWSSTTDLGHVQSGQFVGYLFPMGPWFAAADALGVSIWVAQRVWLGLLLGLAAWGVVRLMDELYRPERGVAHVLAGLLYLLNPYTVIFTSRGTVTLLAYAALPWLVLAAHRGLANPRGWRWPIGFALILTLAGGGVNAGVIAWALVAPAALLVYEAAVLGRSWRDVWSFAWRAGAARGRGVRLVGGAGAAPGPVRRGVPLLHGAARARSGAPRACPSRSGCSASGRCTWGSASASPSRSSPRVPRTSSTRA